MISFDEAFERVCSAAVPLGSETVKLSAAHGRILAAPVIAAVISPPCDMSAMDGYAVREADLSALPVSLHVSTEVFAGVTEPGEIAEGECARIFTGAPIPAGADRVIVQEVVEREGDQALFSQPLVASSHIRKCGNDFAAGDTLLQAGRKLDFRALVAAAGGDVADLACWRRPRIAVIASGDELVEPGTARTTAGTIPESVAPGVVALVHDCGGEVVAQSRLPDDLEQMEKAAGEALASVDLVVITGGASVGERDFAKQMFEPAGLELIFSKVAMKPGKPVWLGRASGKLVMGLPGNPTSAMATGRLLLAPLIKGLCGGEPRSGLDWRNVEVAARLPAVGDRETFVRAAIDQQGRAVPLGNQNSSAQHALADADLLIRRPADADAVEAGAGVAVINF